MKAEDISLYYCCQWEVVKKLSESKPYVCISILPQAFIIKAVNLCDLLTLMISPKNGDSVGISDFQANKQSYGLHRVIASVYIITHEKIIIVR